MGNITYL